MAEKLGAKAGIRPVDSELRPLEPQSRDQARNNVAITQILPAQQDHFVSRHGMHFAGTHLILDLWDAHNLSDSDIVEAGLRQAAEEAGATLLNLDLHCFTPNGGITGVAILAESHISIHTWPERAYAAVDVFMCGDAEPYKAVEVLRDAFQPRRMTLSEHRRGVLT